MPEQMATITAQFDPISLAEINRRAALQRRADNKYFLPWTVFLRFAARLRKTHLVLDIDGQRCFTYDTQYFDTPTLDCYWAHVQGRRKRFKCRSRRYVDSDLCFFELKLKGGRGETVKYKMGYGETECQTVTPAAADFLRERLRADYGLVFSHPLLPTVRTHYQRVTLMAQASMERITCDFNLAFALDQRWQGQMAPDYVLVETKSERGRGTADQLLWHLGVRPASGSKYCLGLSLVRPDLRSNPFQQARKSYFMHYVEPQVDWLPTRSVVLPARIAVDALTSLPDTTH
ncbi:MAG TPA: polyphosphate polymerase domain-containing protein [Herpetosiphonaceae bacterium]